MKKQNFFPFLFLLPMLFSFSNPSGVKKMSSNSGFLGVTYTISNTQNCGNFSISILVDGEPTEYILDNNHLSVNIPISYSFIGDVTFYSISENNCSTTLTKTKSGGCGGWNVGEWTLTLYDDFTGITNPFVDTFLNYCD